MKTLKEDRLVLLSFLMLVTLPFIEVFVLQNSNYISWIPSYIDTYIYTATGAHCISWIGTLSLWGVVYLWLFRYLQVIKSTPKMDFIFGVTVGMSILFVLSKIL